MIAAIVIIGVIAIVVVIVLITFDFTDRRMCRCDQQGGGRFVPNAHDDLCVNCRGHKPTPVAGPPVAPVSFTGPECDFGCGSREYSHDANPFVQIRQQRPSDKSDMCCIMWGHAECAGAPVGTLPSISTSGGVATPAQWEDWIESVEARKEGFLFIT